MERTYLHISYNISKDCINDKAYHTCYRCNACGRVNKDSQREDAIKMYKKHIEEEKSFDRWRKGHEEIQRKNIAKNIEYFQSKLGELENNEEEEMDIKEYQEKSKRTLNKELSKSEVLGNMGLGLTGEAGEVADIIKKHLYQGHDLAVEDIKDELGDVMWYIANLCSVCDLKLEDVLKHNVRKLQKRFPDGFSEEDSINRRI